MVDKLELPVDKKDRIFKCINALQSEIDRGRTRYETLGALLVVGSDEAADRVDRWVPTLKAITSVFRASKEAEEKERQSLPAPKEVKRIEVWNSPSDKPTERSFDKPLDDEIPF